MGPYMHKKGLKTNTNCLDELECPWFSLAMDRLTKEYKFKDFAQAMEFVNEVARIAESRDHHPDILVKYNQVSLTYWTHTENMVTDKDKSLAAEVDNLLNKRNAKI